MKEKNYLDTGGYFARRLSVKSPDQISIKYSYMSPSEHLTFVSEIFNKLDIELAGVGMEVAAGAGVFSCSLARLYPNITKIYALEIVPEVTTLLQPKLIEFTGTRNKVLPFLGDFNKIGLADSSLDFVVGFDSLHHSSDLNKTLTEISRVLKPGGKLVFFDRAHPNHMTKAQETFLLKTEYSTEYKIEHGISVGDSLSREQQGEHEPRLRDWYNSFADTDLQLDTIAIFAKRTAWGFLKILASHIPYVFRSRLGIARNLVSHSKLFLFYILPAASKYGKLKIFPLRTRLTPVGPKGKMIFIASKVKRHI